MRKIILLCLLLSSAVHAAGVMTNQDAVNCFFDYLKKTYVNEGFKHRRKVVLLLMTIGSKAMEKTIMSAAISATMKKVLPEVLELAKKGDFEQAMEIMDNAASGGAGRNVGIYIDELFTGFGAPVRLSKEDTTITVPGFVSAPTGVIAAVCPKPAVEEERKQAAPQAAPVAAASPASAPKAAGASEPETLMGSFVDYLTKQAVSAGDPRTYLRDLYALERAMGNTDKPGNPKQAQKIIDSLRAEEDFETIREMLPEVRVHDTNTFWDDRGGFARGAGVKPEDKKISPSILRELQ